MSNCDGEINFVVLRRIQAAVQSVSSASELTVTAMYDVYGVAATYRGLNSPYVSHRFVEFTAFWVQEDDERRWGYLELNTANHSLIITSYPLPNNYLLRRHQSYLGDRPVKAEWVCAKLPLVFLKPIFRRLKWAGFMFNVPFRESVYVYTLLPKIRFDEHGRPIPVLIEEEQKEHCSVSSSTSQ